MRAVEPYRVIGLSSSDEIESLDSSCECVKPTLVRYSVTSTTVAAGLLLGFIAEDDSSSSPLQPVQLAVEIKLTLVGGKCRTVTVNFLHAPVLEQGKL